MEMLKIKWVLATFTQSVRETRLQIQEVHLWNSPWRKQFIGETISCSPTINFRAFLVAQRLKHLPAMQQTQVRSLGWEDPLEKEMVTHSSIFVWRIPWMEKPGMLQSTGSQRVGRDWATSLTHLTINFHPNFLTYRWAAWNSQLLHSSPSISET